MYVGFTGFDFFNFFDPCFHVLFIIHFNGKYETVFKG